jgi:imidazole glycerol-phosphate synthase subunit HisH
MIIVIDYGTGNTRSVCGALRYLGASVQLSADLTAVEQAQKIVLPGVGAFGPAMSSLRATGLVVPLLHAVVERNVPILGICLGAQLLAERSLEFGDHEGLGLIPGVVRKLWSVEPLRLPHIGWNNIRILGESPLFKDLTDSESFYFVHSFAVDATNSDDVIARCHYGAEFVAALQRKNIYAVQFHPEKSQRPGLQLLRNFVEL